MQTSYSGVAVQQMRSERRERERERERERGGGVGRSRIILGSLEDTAVEGKEEGVQLEVAGLLQQLCLEELMQLRCGEEARRSRPS